MIMPKKPKLNIECTDGKTKKCYKHNLTGSPKKTIKSLEIKQAKGKKHCKKDYKINT